LKIRYVHTGRTIRGFKSLVGEDFIHKVFCLHLAFNRNPADPDIGPEIHTIQTDLHSGLGVPPVLTVQPVIVIVKVMLAGF
jgi:hypothetical protein